MYLRLDACIQDELDLSFLRIATIGLDFGR
jgi:hypothetical protein